jgi:hypothetical protein
MARTVTVENLIRRIRKRADMQSSAFFTDDDILDLLNEAYPELYDTLTQAFQNYYAESTPITLVAGTAAYDLPADFYKLISVDYLVSGPIDGGTYEALFPYNEMERNATLGITSSIPNGTVRMRYIPACPVLTLSDSLDGIDGWDAYIVTDVAIMMLDAEESNTDRLERRRQRLLQRIMSASQNRDVTMPGQVADVTVYSLSSFRDTLRYRFYGDRLEFINVTYTGV